MARGWPVWAVRCCWQVWGLGGTLSNQEAGHRLSRDLHLRSCEKGSGASSNLAPFPGAESVLVTACEVVDLSTKEASLF